MKQQQSREREYSDWIYVGYCVYMERGVKRERTDEQRSPADDHNAFTQFQSSTFRELGEIKRLRGRLKNYFNSSLWKLF